MKIKRFSILSFFCLLALVFSPLNVYAEDGTGENLYLPVVFRNYNPYSPNRTVNAPYTTRFVESAVFWFGRVSPGRKLHGCARALHR